MAVKPPSLSAMMDVSSDVLLPARLYLLKFHDLPSTATSLGPSMQACESTTIGFRP